MISLDMRTAFMVFVLIGAISLVIITLLWHQNRKHFAGISFWVVDHAMQLLAIVLIALRGKIPDLVSIVLSNTMVLAGFILLYIGLQRFIGKKTSQVQNYIYLAIFIIIHTYYTTIQPNLAVRTINGSIGIVILSFQCLWLLLRKADPDIRLITRGAGIAFIFICLTGTIRIILLIIFPMPSNNLFESPVFDTFLLIILYLLSFVYLPFNLIMMVSGRLVLITQKNEEELSLRASLLKDAEERFRNLANATFEGIMIHDRGVILDANQSFANMLNSTPQELIGKNGMESIPFTPDSRKLIMDHIKTGNEEAYEIEIERQDGANTIMETQGRNINYNGRDARVISMRDITQHKIAEKELQEYKDHLEELIKTRTDELSTANRKLQKEIGEHKQAKDELSIYTEQLEIFNKAMVDREMRIIEMKEEINHLCQELGREPIYPPIWH